VVKLIKKGLNIKIKIKVHYHKDKILKILKLFLRGVGGGGQFSWIFAFLGGS